MSVFPSLRRFDERRLHDLFLLNIALQIFDGVATYEGLKLGWREANPLLLSSFEQLGIAQSLLLFKAGACGLVLLLHRYRYHPSVPAALLLVAGVHLLLSFFPWAAKFTSLALRAACAG